MSIRQRTAFKFDDGESGPTRILDEQEQEQVIEALKKKSQASNGQYQMLLQVVVGLSAVLHSIYLCTPSRESPFAVFFAPSKDASAAPIPGSTLFAWLSLFLHINLVVHLLATSHTIRSKLVNLAPGDLSKYVPLPFFWIFVSSLVTPTFAALLRANVAEVLWWSTTSALSWFVWVVQRWIRQEQHEIERLEGMRYEAKGA